MGEEVVLVEGGERNEVVGERGKVRGLVVGWREGGDMQSEEVYR